MSSEKIIKELRERIIQNFFDIILLRILKDSRSPLDIGELCRLVRVEFGVLLDSGMLHTLLYAMERKGLIHGVSEVVWEQRVRRVYELTENGKKIIEILQKRRGDIINLIKILF